MNLVLSNAESANIDKTLRSLAATLEFATTIAATLPSTLSEIDQTLLALNEAYVACCRLNLANSAHLQPEHVNDQAPKSMSA